MGKKAVAKATKKAVASKKKSTMKKGDKYSCTSCGLMVTVDELCGCVDFCDIMCCGAPMKPAKSKK